MDDEFGGTKLDRHCLFSLTTSYLISIRHAQTVLVIEMRRVPPAEGAAEVRADVNKRKTSLEIVFLHSEEDELVNLNIHIESTLPTIATTIYLKLYGIELSSL
ncbi:hypothetical protein J6590_006584 [Homalodisca vitripennis]|nr:hypothetical protein J6590_006584 [Homalodisca vitripennis]